MGSDMASDGRRLPATLPVYSDQLDALQAGSRWLQGVWGMAEGMGLERIIERIYMKE